MRELEQRVFRTVADVLGMDPVDVSPETSHDNAPNWDSVNTLQLVLALEAEFDISIEPEEVADMLSVGLIIEILKQKVANHS